MLYVGMTRAKDRLVLSRAAQRLWRGRVRTLSASSFLLDIEQELVKQQHGSATEHAGRTSTEAAVTP